MITDAQRQEAGRLGRDLKMLAQAMAMMAQARLSYGRQGAWLSVGEIE